MKNKRYAVVGVGQMGSYHIRVLSEMPAVDLVALCDTNKQAAETLALKYHIASAYGRLKDMLEKEDLDAIIISSPTFKHFQIAKECMQEGVNLFIEKPMASTEEECQKIINFAEDQNLHLMVGHIERFNPVIIKLKEFIDKGYIGDIYYIDTIRSGPFPKRLYGNRGGVVLDLAVHDLDLVNYLFGPITQIFAHHILTESHKQDIYAKVMFKTKKVLGNSEFSWISPKKERRISIYGDRGLLVGNLLDQEIWYFENGDVGIEYNDNYYRNVLWGRVSEGKVIKYPIKKEEPLKKEHDFFLRILNNQISDYDPLHAKLAIKYSLSVLKSATENRVINFKEV